MKTIYLPDADATTALAQDVANRLVGAGWRWLGLSGPLGAGKSHFARAVIRALPLPGGQLDPFLEVPSPTYTLIQTYTRQIGEVWHMDAYRLSNTEELVELGWHDATQDAALVIVEWPENLGSHWPQSDSLWLRFSYHDKGRYVSGLDEIAALPMAEDKESS